MCRLQDKDCIISSSYKDIKCNLNGGNSSMITVHVLRDY